MAVRKRGAGTDPETKQETPIRVPPKMGTQGPESGPTAETVVDADAPAPASEVAVPGDPKEAKAQQKLQAKAENEKAARDVKVRATRRGYLGHQLREEGDVFVLQLAKGQPLPSWVEAVPEATATTPPTHSSEAREMVVGKDGIGREVI